MQDIIRILCDIEANADQIMDNAKKEKADMAKIYEDKTAAAEAEIREKALKRLEKHQEYLEIQAKKELNKIRATAAADIEALDENYKINHDKYVMEIFNHITGA